ncbi:MAG: branched-chain amino acid ABC transporter substrate-binding protein [Burkholderiales bacterium]|nr:ABC transporter substrate-binding protein [Burkholderiaceae bacterium]
MKLVNRIAVSSAMCVAGLAFAPAQAQEIKLGVHATLSGAGAVWGQAMLGAAELAADEVNAKGGLEVAGKKYRVVVTSYDDKYKANDAVTAMNRLINDDKIRFVVGPLGSAAAVAVLPMATDDKVITMTMAFTPKALGKEFPYSFRPVISSAEFSDPQIAWVVKKLNVKRVGGLFPNDESGQQVGAANAKAYEKVGANFEAREYFERERVDFVPLLTRLFAKNIDTIELNGNAPTTAALIVKQAREMGFKGPIIRTGGDATGEIVKVAGKAAAEGVYVHQTINPADAKVADYIKRFQAKYKSEMNAFSPMFHANVQMLFGAMQQAKTTTDLDKIRDAMASMKDYDTVIGKVSWSGEQAYGIKRQLDAPFYVGVIRDGVSQIVAKCSLKSCD